MRMGQPVDSGLKPFSRALEVLNAFFAAAGYIVLQSVAACRHLLHDVRDRLGVVRAQKSGRCRSSPKCM